MPCTLTYTQYHSLTLNKYCASRLPFACPTLPPCPCPSNGRSGRFDCTGSFRAFSRCRFLEGSSLNMGSAWGLCMAGASTLLHMSSGRAFLGALATHTSAPLSLSLGSYSTCVPPSFLSPVVANTCMRGARGREYELHDAVYAAHVLWPALSRGSRDAHQRTPVVALKKFKAT